jgi:DNA polymerase-3 subunit gamma/tau
VLPEREFAAPLSSPEAKAYLAMAEGLSIAVLARAWQVLLKGVSEVQTAPQPMIALEMLIIRLCHIGTLPLPGDLLKKLEQVDLSTLSVAAVAGAAPLPQGAPVAMIGGGHHQAGSMMRRAAGDGVSASAYAQPMAQTVAAAQPQNWRQLVAFVREQQEMHLAAQLYGAVECISYAPGRLNLFLREGVSPALAPRLSQQLTAWLGQPWMITLANTPTRPTLSEEDEAEHNDMLAKVAEHPLVRSVLLAFPGAKLSSVREPEVQEVDIAAGQGLPNSAIYDDEDGVFPTTDFLET